jgi:hypothetical protein
VRQGGAGSDRRRGNVATLDTGRPCPSLNRPYRAFAWPSTRSAVGDITKLRNFGHSASDAGPFCLLILVRTKSLRTSLRFRETEFQESAWWPAGAGLQWAMLSRIVITWLVTLPVTIVIAGRLYYLLESPVADVVK